MNRYNILSVSYHVIHVKVRQEEVQTTPVLLTCSIGEVVTANSRQTGEYSRETAHFRALERGNERCNRNKFKF